MIAAALAAMLAEARTEIKESYCCNPTNQLVKAPNKLIATQGLAQLV